jgi:hypothetical protein
MDEGEFIPHECESFPRGFPAFLVSKFMGESIGILHYIYLLRSSVEYCSDTDPLASEIVVYQGFKAGGSRFAPLSHSMIGEVIVWSGFRSISASRYVMISHFITAEDSILFGIVLHDSGGYREL